MGIVSILTCQFTHGHFLLIKKIHAVILGGGFLLTPWIWPLVHQFACSREWILVQNNNNMVCLYTYTCSCTGSHLTARTWYSLPPFLTSLSTGLPWWVTMETHPSSLTWSRVHPSKSISTIISSRLGTVWISWLAVSKFVIVVLSLWKYMYQSVDHLLNKGGEFRMGQICSERVDANKQ